MTSINATTQLIGLIGWPVSHSFSPAMHNAALAALELNWVYLPLPVPPGHVESAVRGLHALGIRGVNVTVPHKQGVMPYLDEISPAASTIGAVNTILVEQESGRLSGSNTDWQGFLADLAAKEVEINGRDCLVLGAGGSARGIVYALGRAGGRVLLLARRTEQAHQLDEDLGDGLVQEIWPMADLKNAIARMNAPLIINTTTLGMSPHVDGSPWPDDVPWPDGSFVYDLVYNPPETRLMRQAVDAGCGACNGLGMLLRQGAISFAQWTGIEPNLDIMQEALQTAGGVTR